MKNDLETRRKIMPFPHTKLQRMLKEVKFVA